ncbi:hypothetical protein [Cohnella fermenti]|uniref:Uncharacterized protein n=1 Tax=Cohnella fermenti TaxID=2565925 RepID=A0A4S4C705_9BACL|nr:hypothetical protein [Cohnella fermenti]THF83717.1 hypothetical protein E6C55_03230 [Cohnella fermenti]
MRSIEGNSPNEREFFYAAVQLFSELTRDMNEVELEQFEKDVLSVPALLREFSDRRPVAKA